MPNPVPLVGCGTQTLFHYPFFPLFSMFSTSYHWRCPGPKDYLVPLLQIKASNMQFSMQQRHKNTAVA